MARSDEVWVQLATRIPKELHRDLKLHCVRTETSVMDFVTQAIDEKLAGANPLEARPARPYKRSRR
jgi:hypothetical protein